MLDPLGGGVDAAVHHRRGRPQAGLVHVAHHREPLVGGGLGVAVQLAADAVDENLGAPAGDAVEPGRHQPAHHRRHRLLRQPRQVQDLGGREGVEPEVGVPGLDRREQVLVPLEGEIGVVPALQQELIAPDRARLVDLAEQLVEAQHVALGGPHRTIERTEVAPRHAHVRVVHVPVDDVRHHPGGMPASPNAVGEAPEQRRRRPGVELQRLAAVDAAAVAHPFGDGRDAHSAGHS